MNLIMGEIMSIVVIYIIQVIIICEMIVHVMILIITFVNTPRKLKIKLSTCELLKIVLTT